MQEEIDAITDHLRLADDAGDDTRKAIWHLSDAISDLLTIVIRQQQTITLLTRQAIAQQPDTLIIAPPNEAITRRGPLGRE